MKHQTASADLAGRSQDAERAEGAWVKTPADIAWAFCERAARGDPLTYAEVKQGLSRFDERCGFRDARGDRSPEWMAACEKLAQRLDFWRMGDHAAAVRGGEPGWLIEQVCIEALMEAATADPRKPWVEPTVTALPRTPANIRPAALSKPRVPTQTDNGELYFDQLVSEIPSDWSAQGYLSRMHEVADMAAVGRSLIGVIAEITRPGATVNCLEGWAPADDPVEIVGDLLNKVHDRDAEIAELQGMLEEAIGPVRLVSDLANMTEFECQVQRVTAIRDVARQKLYGHWKMPRLYGDEDRKRAVADLLSLPEMRAGDTEAMSALLCVDTVAAALGLRRAS